MDNLQAKGSGPQRDKHWEELDADGKIERCRRVIKEQENIIRHLNDYVNRLIGHEHLNGKIVQPIGHPNAESTGGFYYRKRSDGWF